MAQDIQGMLVRIEATTAQLRQEMKRADAAVANATKGIDRELSLVDKAFDRMGLSAEKSKRVAVSAMKNIGTAIGAAAAAGAAGLATLVVKTAESAREIQNLSRVANASTTEFQRYAAGAKTVGIEQDKLSDILKDVNDRVGDFLTTGGGEMKDFFENIAPRIGVTAEQFRKLSGPQALQLFYSSLEKANLSQAEMTFYMEAMANDTTALIPLLKNGGAGFKEMGDQAQAMGAVLSDLEIKQLEEFTRSTDEMKLAFRGASNQITTDLLPTIKDLTGLLKDPATVDAARVMASGVGQALVYIVERSVDAINWMRRLKGEIADNDIALLEAEIKRVTGMLDGSVLDRTILFGRDGVVEYYDDAELNAELVKLVVALNKAKADAAREPISIDIQAPNLRTLPPLLQDNSKAAKEAAKALEELSAKYDPAAKAQAEYEKGIALADKALLDGTYTTEQYQKVVQGLYTDLNKPIWDKQNEASDKAKEALKKLDDQLESVRDRLDPVRAATKRLTAEKKLFKDQLDAGAISLEEYTEGVALLEKEYDENTRATSEWAQWTEGALDRVDSAFADAWRNIGDGFDGFRNSLTDAFRQMLAELAHMAITKPIIMQIGAAMGIGSGTQGNNGIWGSLLGGSSGSSGGGIGGALQVANQGRGLLSSYGTIQSMWPALQGGWGSGGFGGMLSAGGSYLGSMFGVGSGAAGSLAAGSTAAGYTGAGMQAWVAAQSANTAATSGLSSAISGMSGMLTNPVTWIVAGMLASNKLWDQGVRISGSDTAKLNTGSRGAVGDVAWAPFTAGSYAVELMDKSLSFVADPLNLFGDKVDKAVAIFTGSPVTQAITNFLGKGLFGGEWETKNYGLTAEVANGGFGSFSYQYQKKDGGWFGSDKKRTIYTPIEQETNQALNDTYDAVESGVVDLFARLNLEVSDAALAGINIARTDISTKGKTEEEVNAAVTDWFATAGESINTQLNAALGTGLELDLAGMQAFIGNLEGVREVLRYLDVSMYDMSVAGGKLAESLSAAAGGLDALATNSQTYYAAFFSEAEKVEDTVDSIKRAFESADVELAGSREAYRAMVEDIDLTTEAGQEMFATMMALSGQAAQYYSIVEQQAAQATAVAEQAAAAAAQAAAAQIALLGMAVDSAYAKLQRSAAAQQQAIQSSVSTVSASISALTGIGNSLDAALKRLRGTSDDAVRSLRAQAVMTLNSALVQARSGQSLAGFAGLEDALDTASQMDTALYSSLTDFEREQGRTANLIAELEQVNGKQLSAEQKALQMYKQQLDALDEQLKFAQDQLDALNGIDNGILSMTDAIKLMNASVVAALSGLADGLSQLNTPENNATIVDTLYKSILGREADAAGKEYWQGQLQTGALDYDQIATAIANAAKANPNESAAGQAAAGSYLASTVQGAYQSILGHSADQAGLDYWIGQLQSGALNGDQLQEAIRNAAKANGQIPAFASGGFHAGGVRLVGENGPELEVTGPSRIYNASQTAAMLGGAGSTEELRALRGEVAGLRDALHSIAKHTEKTAHGVDQIKDIGIPQEEAA